MYLRTLKQKLYWKVTLKTQVIQFLNTVRLEKLCDKEIVKHMHMVSFQSGKLVTKMFQKIQELIDDKDALVFVLIDEV